MKKVLVISLWATIIVVMLDLSFALGWYDVCIDPGHGGEDEPGAVGPVYGVCEKDANLSVALALREKIEYYIYPVLMTRETDTTVSAYRRAWMANNANGVNPVNHFISVHHNGWPDTSRNGTETYYCNAEYTDTTFGPLWRGPEWMYGARDSTLAKKVRLTLRDSLQHIYRCSPQILCGDTTQPCCMACFYVLRNTTMQSVLSKASFITNPWVEYQFYHNTDYIDKEAGAICTGWWSTYLMGGIAVVRNGYSAGADCGYGGLVAFGDYYNDLDTVPSPYEAVWTLGEGHYVQAITPQDINGHWYTFHHWTHLFASGEPFGEESYDPLWWVSTGGEFDYHRYVAYFTGGLYSAQVLSPDGYENWNVDEQRDIVWDVSIGADSTTMVYVYLDRNGGNDGYPEYLGNWSAELTTCFTWTVTAPYSTYCRIKVVAEDIVGNYAEDISDRDFSISESGNNDPEIDGHIQCKYPESQCYDCIHYGEAVTIEIPAHDPDGDSMFYEWWCPIPFGGHFSNGQKTMTTAQNYVTYIAPTKGKEEQTQYFRDLIHVTVIDVRGGQNWAEGHPELHDQPYPCLCGDANNDGAVGAGDIVYLLVYLNMGGPPPPDPYLRGDANNNCEVEAGDVVYLLSYLFRHGPPPECCWFSPSSRQQ